MTERDEQEMLAFLAAIKENRYDEVTRRVFADWLEERGQDDHAVYQRQWTREWQEAEDWLVYFADRIAEPDPEDNFVQAVILEQVVEAGRRAFESGDHSCVSGMGFAAESLMDDDETREAFWKHWAVYTRTEVTDEVRERTVFSCSC